MDATATPDDLEIRARRVADEAERLSAIAASFDDRDDTDLDARLVRGIRGFVDLAANGYAEALDAEAGQRFARHLAGHRDAIRATTFRANRSDNVEPGLEAVGKLANLFGRPWEDIAAERDPNGILDDIARVVMLANDLETAVLAKRIADRKQGVAAPVFWLN